MLYLSQKAQESILHGTILPQIIQYEKKLTYSSPYVSPDNLSVL